MTENFRTGPGGHARRRPADDDVALLPRGHLVRVHRASGPGVPLVMARGPRGGRGVRAHPPSQADGDLDAAVRRCTALVNDAGCTREDFASFRYVATAGDKAAGRARTALRGGRGVPAARDLRHDRGDRGSPSRPRRAGNPGGDPPGRPGRRPSPGPCATTTGDRGVEPGEVGGLWIRYPGATMVGYWNRPGVDGRGVLRTGGSTPATSSERRRAAGIRLVHAAAASRSSSTTARTSRRRRSRRRCSSIRRCRRAGVVGVHDVRHGEDVWAYVALTPGAPPPTPAELIAFAARTGRLQGARDRGRRPRRALPVNAVGKTDRTTLKRMAAETHGAHDVR